MKVSALAVALLLLSGCSALYSLTNPEAAKEREITRRYKVCMQEQLGRFGSFASPETRRKASESCQQWSQSETSTPNP